MFFGYRVKTSSLTMRWVEDIIAKYSIILVIFDGLFMQIISLFWCVVAGNDFKDILTGFIMPVHAILLLVFLVLLFRNIINDLLRIHTISIGLADGIVEVGYSYTKKIFKTSDISVSCDGDNLFFDIKGYKSRLMVGTELDNIDRIKLVGIFKKLGCMDKNYCNDCRSKYCAGISNFDAIAQDITRYHRRKYIDIISLLRDMEMDLMISGLKGGFITNPDQGTVNAVHLIGERLTKANDYFDGKTDIEPDIAAWDLDSELLKDLMSQTDMRG